MSYASTVRRNVDKAFKLIKDLAVDVVLSTQATSGFDFANNTALVEPIVPRTVRAVFTSKRRSTTDSTIQQSFLLKASDISDPTGYDTITVSNPQHAAFGVWKIIPPYSNDGYIISINVAREA